MGGLSVVSLYSYVLIKKKNCRTILMVNFSNAVKHNEVFFYFSSHRFKQRFSFVIPPANDLYAILDSVKVRMQTVTECGNVESSTTKSEIMKD